MIIDGHCHIGELPGVPLFTGEDLAKKMEEDGIDMTIAFSDPFNLDNEYSAKVMKKFPNKIIGFAFINPRLKTAVDQLKRAIEVQGLKGMKRKNVYVDTAAVAAAEITLAVEIAGANKIVMGSDNPYWSPKLEVEKIKMAVPDPSKRELILAENYRKLLKL